MATDTAKAIKLVQATKDGTYPRPGETYAIYRRKGEQFELNDPSHFATEWMREVKPGEAVVEEGPARPIPQTAGRRGKPLNPFPPMA